MNFDPNTLTANSGVHASGVNDNVGISARGVGDIGGPASDLDALFNTAAYFNVPGGKFLVGWLALLQVVHPM